ncbi:MAG: prepilin peptidase, partial [Pseudomonadota bacterium]|nr:prepilin peptidase [Pseudomonadota bacterium]
PRAGGRPRRGDRLRCERPGGGDMLRCDTLHGAGFGAPRELLLPDWLWPNWLWPVMVAPFVGSFLGVVIRRLSAGGTLGGRSRCEACRRPLAWHDLVPLASFAWLGGRCRQCRAPIALFHPAVELAAVAVPLTAAFLAPEAEPSWWLWAGCGLGWTLLALGWIDWECFLLPDALTLPLIVAGLVATWLDPGRLDQGQLAGHALAAAGGYAVPQLVNRGYRALRGRDGLGGGDAKLLAAAGAWVGLWGLLATVWLGAIIGLLLAVLMWLRGARITAAMRIPFGCCLAFALWLVWLRASAG